MKPRVVITVMGMILLAAFPTGAMAQNEDDGRGRGLTIAPLRSQLGVDAGKTATGSILVTNFTSETASVTIAIEKFSVKDGTYEYLFGATDSGWIRFAGDKKFELKPNEERKVDYSVAVPDHAPSGGYYYALLAGMDVPGSSITSELRVASLLYVTVDGDDVSRRASVTTASLPPVTMGPHLAYRYDAKNDGNVHFNAVTYSRLKGPFFESQSESGTSILMPNTFKTLSSSVSFPVLPGIYELEYGFKDDQDRLVTKTASIVFVPFWSVVVAMLVTVGAGALVRRAYRARAART